jgi:hypothetical protein
MYWTDITVHTAQALAAPLAIPGYIANRRCPLLSRVGGQHRPAGWVSSSPPLSCAGVRAEANGNVINSNSNTDNTVMLTVALLLLAFSLFSLSTFPALRPRRSVVARENGNSRGTPLVSGIMVRSASSICLSLAPRPLFSLLVSGSSSRRLGRG